MPFPPARPLLLSLILGAFLSSPVHAADYERFVRIMGLHELVLQSLRWPWDIIAEADEDAPPHTECVRDISPDIFIPDLTRFAAKQVRPQDVEPAIALFDTEGWRRFSRDVVQRLTDEMAEKPERPPAVFTDQQEEEITAIQESPLGEKFLTEDFLFAAPVHEKLAALWDKEVDACAARFAKAP